jgi:signal transduction histidine kinase
MLKKLSLRLRITLVSVLLLLVCCLGLTFALNYSAYQMADVIEAVPISPSFPENVSESGGIAAAPILPSFSAAEARKNYVSQSILWMAAIVTVGGTLTWLITGRALRPLKELNSRMESRTVHNLSESLSVPESRDEVAALTVSFNEMSAKLEDAFATQRRFSQSAAHELRTPLTVLKTKLDVFRKKPNRTQEEYDTLFCAFETQTDRLSRLVSELLKLTSMDALECKEEIALAPMLSDIVQELADLAAKQGVTVSLICDALTVRGNSSLLHRAVYNLVENAIKYNRQGGAALLAAKQVNGRTHICVTDTGAGIADEQKTLIFEPFYRVDKSRSRKFGGAGLGLSTVKTIIDKHGGKVFVTDNPGGGSVFTVLIPR